MFRVTLCIPINTGFNKNKIYFSRDNKLTGLERASCKNAMTRVKIL